MRSTQFLRAVLELASATEIEQLLAAALELSARCTGASRVWIEVPSRCGLLVRSRGEGGEHELVATVRSHCHDGAIGVARATPFSNRARDRLALLAAQLAILLERIALDHPGISMAASVDELKQRRVARSLERNHRNVAATARELGVARSHVYDLARSLRRCRAKCSR